jgi:hypothetical protein
MNSSRELLVAVLVFVSEVRMLMLGFAIESMMLGGIITSTKVIVVFCLMFLSTSFTELIIKPFFKQGGHSLPRVGDSSTKHTAQIRHARSLSSCFEGQIYIHERCRGLSDQKLRD